MFTVESFCNRIWNETYSEVQRKIDTSEYKEFSIPKKDGMRTINYLESDSELGSLQYQLMAKFLNKQRLPICVKGFVKGENYNSFLIEHIGAKYFMRVDIKSFFPSINKAQIISGLSDVLIYNDEEVKNTIAELISDIVTLNGALPQGACTSPMISNIVMARIDQRITKYCQAYDVHYTRYADDLLFSSESIDFEEEKWFLKKVKYILRDMKLSVNYSKLKYGKNRFVLNGYVISDEGISLSRNRLSDIRHIVTFINNNKHYVEDKNEIELVNRLNSINMKYRDLDNCPFKNTFQIMQYLCGYRAFIISIIDNNETTKFQKEMKRLIRRIETELIDLAKYKYDI